jgi:two-component sensor histidine kinase
VPPPAWSQECGDPPRAPFALEGDRAISLALIVNELVTNAVKHGLSGRRDGHICVRVDRHDENTALISVRDDGLPAEMQRPLH